MTVVETRHVAPNGRLVNSHHNNRTLDVERLRQAAALLAAGERHRAIRGATGLSTWTIGQLGNGTHWAIREGLVAPLAGGRDG